MKRLPLLLAAALSFPLADAQAPPGAVGAEPHDRPKITVYRAPAASANAAAVVICPGGGYRNLSSDKEGRQVAEWLNFSAGGHLASTAGTRFDDGRPDAADPAERFGSRPDFMILAYPVISLSAPFTHRASLASLLGDPPDMALAEELSNEKRVTARTPPAFLFHTGDDPSVPVANSLAFFAAMRAEGVPAELHVFEKGPHGVGLAQWDPALSAWPRLCEAWLRTRGLLARK